MSRTLDPHGFERRGARFEIQIVVLLHGHMQELIAIESRLVLLFEMHVSALELILRFLVIVMLYKELAQRHMLMSRLSTEK